MTQISAKMVADSVNEFGHRISTLELVYPRIIHGELMTHRLFSRNSSSSRAVPFNKMVEAVQTNPFIPIAWQKSHSGMQGTEYITDPFEIQRRVDAWLKARDAAILQAKFLHEMGTTKQICNRLLEPFMYHKVLVTSTEFNNFFNLRCPQYQFLLDIGQTKYRSKKDVIKQQSDLGNNEPASLTDLNWLSMNKSQAEIHIQAVAEAMWDAIKESSPRYLKAGEYHIPYGDNIEMSILDQHEIARAFPDITSLTDLKCRISVASAARVSYTVVGSEKQHDFKKDLELYASLLASGHLSPHEHVARAMSQDDLDNYILVEDGVTIPGVCRNFTGFIQHRALIEKVFK